MDSSSEGIARLDASSREKASSESDTVSGEYTYLPIERVHFGPRVVSKLHDELARLESVRPFVITGQTIANKTDLVSKVERASGGNLAGVFSGIRQHTPESDVQHAITAAKEAKADSLISLGGGSPIDATKVVVKETSDNFRRRALPHIALPTTLSAAEFSHSAGLTDERLNRKTGFRDVRMTPRLVFLDPELTLSTPGWLWASTGVRSLDHAVESILSPNHQPYVDALALEAIRLIFQNLKGSAGNEGDLKSRTECQLAAWMSYAGAFSVGTGISHAIGRVIGATWGIPHGITSCLTLAEVMRAEAKRTPSRLALIAAAEGQDVKGVSKETAAVTAADGVARLVEEIGLSKRLREYKIERSDLPGIAETVGGPERSREILRILEEIW